MLTCAQSIRMSESLSRRRIWPLMCYAFKWSFTAAYLFLLVMGTVGFLRDFSGWLLITLGLPWTLFLDSFGKIDGLSGVSPVVLKNFSRQRSIWRSFSQSARPYADIERSPKADALAPDLR